MPTDFDLNVHLEEFWHRTNCPCLVIVISRWNSDRMGAPMPADPNHLSSVTPQAKFRLRHAPSDHHRRARIEFPHIITVRIGAAIRILRMAFLTASWHQTIHLP